MASACEKCHYFICRCGDHEELKALRAEVDENRRLRRIINMAGGSPPPGRLQFTDILLPLEAENKHLKDDLIEYGRHGEGCPNQYDKKYPCKCGWLETLKALKGE